MGTASANLPAELVRRYDVVVKPSAKQRSLRLREVSADHIGRLVVLQVSSHPTQAQHHLKHLCCNAQYTSAMTPVCSW